MKRETTGSSIDYEIWYSKTHPGFSIEKAGSFYSTAMEERHTNVAARRLEVQKFVSAKDPSFGYGALGGIITSEKVGSLCNVIITTNFDDLVSDALFLFHHVKPLIIPHQDLAPHAIPSQARPLIVKLHGDALLDPLNSEDETKRLPGPMLTEVVPVSETGG
jgi:hypothetical protein